MDSGYYAAFTGLLARQQALDAVANNLANTNTNGFRAEREFFSDALTGPNAIGSQLNTAVNDYGVLGGNQIDLSQGQMTTTGNPLDLALEGQGFFAVLDQQGTIQYTRDGSFTRSNKGVLTTRQGEPVLDTKGKPITIPSGPVTIAGDGTVSVNGGVAGKIGIFTFASWNAAGAGRRQSLPGAAEDGQADRRGCGAPGQIGRLQPERGAGNAAVDPCAAAGGNDDESVVGVQQRS